MPEMTPEFIEAGLDSLEAVALMKGADFVDRAIKIYPQAAPLRETLLVAFKQGFLEGSFFTLKVARGQTE